MIEYIIDEDYESVRVDRFLRKHLKNINLSEIYKCLEKVK
ncbi:tRNA pseudouridine synthase A [Fusobacterium vincentii ATCC 49256]|uniref:tRNA pseudouridine synthase A n=1 Tax=Fusobacterium vincentii ATCC 49256 TaxID=209882 RepID=Q7P2J3_FUSVC|nr:tRNA pseudouridine synthase A [Fusobacterium vincentii ATCC 49256]